jgi:hypothetical protein
LEEKRKEHNKKIPRAQMTSIVGWARCGSFAAVCSIILSASGCGSAVVAVDGVEKVVMPR